MVANGMHQTRADSAGAGSRSVLAWQIDHVIGEPERNLVEREIRVLDLFRENGVAVAVTASERRTSIGADDQLPDLKFLRRNPLVVGLDDGDFVEKPVRAAALGKELRAFAVSHVSVHGMPVLRQRSIELRQVAFG